MHHCLFATRESESLCKTKENRVSSALRGECDHAAVSTNRLHQAKWRTQFVVTGKARSTDSVGSFILYCITTPNRSPGPSVLEKRCGTLNGNMLRFEEQLQEGLQLL